MNDFKKILSCLLVFLLFCAGTEKKTSLNPDKKVINDLENLKTEVIIPRSETEIAEMIENLKGMTLEQWQSELPYYYGLDLRNNQSMNVIKYCEKKQCSIEEYSLFLVYKNVNLNQCIILSSQPLSNPLNNQYIGCEPSFRNSSK